MQIPLIDVFVRWRPKTELRLTMGQLVNTRLQMMADITPILLGSVVPEPFHVNSKKMAEEKARTPIYCVIDDDQLPIPDNFFSLGIEALGNHPEYGMLAGFPLEYGLIGQPYAAKAFPRWDETVDDVIEAHSIGCPYFVRKGTLTFSEGPLRQYDGILSKVVTDQGLKTGFVRKCLYNHLGYGFSQVERVD